MDDRPRNIAEFVLSIELKVSYGPYLTIVDNIEWDLSNPDNCPEQFAANLVSDYLFERPETLKKVSEAELQSFERALSLEIRRLIDIEIFRQASKLNLTLETLMQAKQ